MGEVLAENGRASQPKTGFQKRLFQLYPRGESA